MKYYYLSGGWEESLAPFFSKMVLSASFTSVVIIGVLLLVTWPRQPLSGFIVSNEIPLSYFLTFAATLIIYCYVNMSCGCGDMNQRGFFIVKYRTDKSTFEEKIDFFQYGLIAFLFHTLVLLLPFLPLLILAASISAVSFIIFIKAVFILYTASLLCRMFGFMLYLFLGRLSTIGFFVALAFIIVFIFGTFTFAPFINPLKLLYFLYESPDKLNSPFVLYMVIVIAAILLLVLVNHMLVRRRIT